MPAIGGAPRQRGGRADHARRVDDRREHAARGCAAPRARRVPARRSSACGAPVTARCVASVTCSAPSESVHAIQGRRCRTHRSRVRSGSAVSSSVSTFVARVFGANAQPVARAARGSARSCGGPASRCPGRRARRWRGPTRSVEPRWLVMPTRVDGPAVVERGARERRARRRAIAAASNSTSPGAGESGRSGARCSATTRRVARRRPRRAPTTSRRRRRAAVSAPRSRRSRPGGARAEGAREAELAGVEDAVRVERRA